MGKPLPVTAEARESLLAQAKGDGRFLINQAESLFAMELAEPLDIAGVSEALGARLPNGDKDREYHFDMVSALQKSMRGSDPDAALYWFAQMLERDRKSTRLNSSTNAHLVCRLLLAKNHDINLPQPIT